MRDVSVITVMRDEWDLVWRLGRSIGWCEDWHIVVTDDGVTDAGVTIRADRLIATWGTRLHIHHHPIPLGESFDAARSVPLGSVKNEWILVLDTDERVPSSTLEVIDSAVQSADDNIGGFWFPRLNYVLTRRLFSPAYWPDWQLRLVRRSAVKFPDGIHKKYKVEGKSVYFKKNPNAAIHHFSFRSNEQFLKKIDVYSTIEARTGHSRAMPPGKALWPAFRYLVVALIKMRGLRDGHAGIHLAVCWAFYRYISCVKGWESSNVKWDFPPAFEESASDMAIRPRSS